MISRRAIDLPDGAHLHSGPASTSTSTSADSSVVGDDRVRILGELRRVA